MGSYLVTGGTGALGQAMTRTLLDDDTTTRVCVFSRSEEKQRTMSTVFGHDSRDRLRFFIGDVRDRDRVALAMTGCDTVIHAAALKQIDRCEYNPTEAVHTNVRGTMNVCHAALHVPGVKTVVVISSDKATEPTTTYGATKALAEKVAVNYNVYAGGRGPKYTAVRYGNVAGSTGSVIPIWAQQAAAGHKIKITDTRMTRFWFTLDGAVAFVRDVAARTKGGEVWIPQLPSFRIVDLRSALCPLAGWEETGVRPFEKLHESMVSKDEAPLTYSVDDYYAICPPVGGPLGDRTPGGGVRVPDGFAYSSHQGPYLSVEELREMLLDVVG